MYVCICFGVFFFFLDIYVYVMYTYINSVSHSVMKWNDRYMTECYDII